MEWRLSFNLHNEFSYTGKMTTSCGKGTQMPPARTCELQSNGVRQSRILGSVSISSKMSYHKILSGFKSHENGSLNYHIAVKLDRHLSSSAAKMPVKFHSNQTVLQTKISQLWDCEILWWDILPGTETAPSAPPRQSCGLSTSDRTTQKHADGLITQKNSKIFSYFLSWIQHDKNLPNFPLWPTWRESGQITKIQF